MTDSITSNRTPSTHGSAPPAASRAGTAERRRFPRTRIRLVVHVHTPTGLETGESVDLSARGLLVRTPVALPVGTRVELKFHPPTWSRPMLVEGLVVRHAGSPRKLGIRFVDVPPGGEKELAEFVHHHLERRPRAASPQPGATEPSRQPGTPATPNASSAPRPAPAPAAADERRAEPRISGRFRVVFRNGEHFLSEYATSLSQNGLFIETALPLALGTILDIDLVVPLLAERISVRGRVVRRVAATPGVQAGVGLELIEAPGAGLSALHELARLFRRRRFD